MSDRKKEIEIQFRVKRYERSLNYSEKERQAYIDGMNDMSEYVNQIITINNREYLESLSDDEFQEFMRKQMK